MAAGVQQGETCSNLLADQSETTTYTSLPLCFKTEHLGHARTSIAEVPSPSSSAKHRVPVSNARGVGVAFTFQCPVPVVKAFSCSSGALCP
ncbi:hypothetical protein BaRGS_00005204 [Batillaria attramentaria]|uniref:Uncharacterized protein n=1 Tax=Batillaria attramentaria TaxID=370345 RepID=A0ABD0LVY9_9CAEN